MTAPLHWGGWARWALPAGLLALEYLALAVHLDLPGVGPLAFLTTAFRSAMPVVIGGAAAGWILGRARLSRAGPGAPPLPPWRPFPALPLHLLAFAATAALAVAALSPGRAPSPLLLAALVAGAVSTALLAAASAAPLRWMAGVARRRWWAPLLAVGLGLLAWRVAAAVEGLWGVQSRLTLRLVQGTLAAAWGTVRVDLAAARIGVGGFEVEVASHCSGVDGVGLVVTFLGLWIAMGRAHLRLRRALWLVPLGALLAFLANVARIATLVHLGGKGLEAVAMGGFHSKLGWILFSAIALSMVAAAERWPWLRRAPGPEAAEADEPGPGPSPGLLVPFLAVLATALVCGLVVDGALDRWYPLRLLAGGLALLAVRQELPSLRPSRALLPAAVGAAVGVGWVLAVRGDPGPLGEALAALAPAARGPWLLLRTAGAVLLIPLIEELAFREFLLGALSRSSRRGARPAAVVVSSLAFGALHSAWIAGALAGLALAAVRLWRGRLGDAVLAHAVANALLAAAALLGGRWDLWG